MVEQESGVAIPPLSRGERRQGLCEEGGLGMPGCWAESALLSGQPSSASGSVCISPLKLAACCFVYV